MLDMGLEPAWTWWITMWDRVAKVCICCFGARDSIVLFKLNNTGSEQKQSAAKIDWNNYINIGTINDKIKSM